MLKCQILNVSYSAADTAITSRGLLNGRKCNRELESATVTVSIIGLLFSSFCHFSQMSQ